MTALNWHWKSFEELDTQTLYKLLALRMEVFIVEQDCPYQDIDGQDQKSFHLFGTNEKNEVLAYMRILPPGLAYEEVAMGRIVTSPKIRRTGSGRKLMKEGLFQVYRHFGADQPIKMSAQTYLVDFYESFGFKSTGKEYLEDDIPHTEMLKMGE